VCGCEEWRECFFVLYSCFRFWFPQTLSPLGSPDSLFANLRFNKFHLNFVHNKVSRSTSSGRGKAPLVIWLEYMWHENVPQNKHFSTVAFVTFKLYIIPLKSLVHFISTVTLNTYNKIVSRKLNFACKCFIEFRWFCIEIYCF